MSASLIVYNDVIVSQHVLGSSARGRAIRKNDRTTTAGGRENINIGPQTRTKREFDFGIKPMPREAWENLYSIFEITEAGGYGFLVQDPSDYKVVRGQGVVAGITGGYQAYKRYQHAPSLRVKDRKLTRLKAATFTAYVDGVATAATLDPATGTFNIAGNPAFTSVTWTGEFYVPVHFLNDQIDWTLERAGADGDRRLFAGPLVTLQEILE